MTRKAIIFLALILIAVALGFLAVEHDDTFRSTMWSELFWLSVGTIATTFLVNAILELDLAAKRRREDEFAFRSFTSTIFASLLAVAKADAPFRDSVLMAALQGNERFAERAAEAARFLRNATDLDQLSYDSHYMDVGGHLRDIAHRFVRLYSSSREEMLDHYHELQALARRWRYREVFTPAWAHYTNSLPPADPQRVERQADFDRHVVEVRTLLGDTGEYLSDLVGRVARGAGMSAAP